MSEDATTKPTLETVLERVNALGEQVSELSGNFSAFSEKVETRFDSFREEIGIRLDRIESMTNQTRAEMLTLRADFKEVRAHIRQTT